MIVNGVLLIALAVCLANLFDLFGRREAFGISEYVWDAITTAAFNVTLAIGVIVIISGFLVAQ
jgi:F0F1-type ATP synthase membrane subunit a